MLCDFHLHTDFSGDSETPAVKQIERAIELGMKRICITDHHDYDVVSECDFNLDLPSYISAMRQLRDIYRDQIQIEIGIELGLQCHIAQYLNELSTQYPFDFIIGSSHFINGLDPYYPEFWENKTEHEALQSFFEISLKRIRSIHCFDSYGHLDYIVRYGKNQNRNYRSGDYRDLIDEILKTLIQNGKGLECNTGGFRYGLGHPNPCEEIMCRYRELGGEIVTIGSDAHTPEYVGYEFNRTAALLSKCGFRYYTVFHQRKPEYIKLFP